MRPPIGRRIVLAIDTHEVVKELKAAGFSEGQAEAVTRVVRRAQDIDLSALATKNDLDWFEKATEAEVEATRKETKAEFEAMRKETKAEFEAVRKETKAQVDVMRSDLATGLAETKSDLLKWILGAIGFQTVAISGAVLDLSHVLKP